MADQDADKKPLYDSELPSDEALDEVLLPLVGA